MLKDAVFIASFFHVDKENVRVYGQGGQWDYGPELRKVKTHNFSKEQGINIPCSFHA